MADPPPKKVGSLRDRIAAFENKASTTTPASPPAPRPKPAGHVSWKPRPASPTPDVAANDESQPEKKVGAGMSAADAKASIGAGGSLRERMAALQGRGGFGGAAPPVAPPKPATEKPKWKPPPKVMSPPPDEDEAKAVTEEHAGSEDQEPKLAHEGDEKEAVKEEGEGDNAEAQEPDAEEEERQRRAAIAARMARLGGARVGMSPPIFGKKPDVPKKTSVPHVEESKPEEEEVKHEAPLSPPAEGGQDASASPAISADVRSPGSASEQEYFAQKNTSSTSLLSADSAATSQPRSPAMPVPAAPRRAAPPRRKAPKSPSPAPATPVIDDGAVVAESPAPGTPQLTSDDASKELQSDVQKSKEDEAELGLSPATQPPETVHTPVGETAAPPSAKPTEEGPVQTKHEEDPVQAVTDNLDELALDNEKEHVQAEPTDQHEEPESHPAPEHHEAAADPEPKPEEEEEEDEDVRRKRIADRLRQQGGFYPFSAPPPPVRKPSEHEAPSRKASEDVAREEPEVAEEPQAAESQEPVVADSARRQSVDSIKSPASPASKPDVPTRRDSQLSAHKVDEAEEETLDGARNVYNDDTVDEVDQEARLADVHAEGADYVDAPEESEPAPPSIHDDSVPVLDGPESEPGHGHYVAGFRSPSPSDEEVYDEAEEFQPPPPPRRTSVPPPPRVVPPTPRATDEGEIYGESGDVLPSPPRRMSVPPTTRTVSPPPPVASPPLQAEDEELYDEPEEVPPPPPRRTSLPPTTHAVPPPSRVPPQPEAVDEEEVYDEPEEVPPPPPRRVSVPPAARTVPPPPPPPVLPDEAVEDEDEVPPPVPKRTASIPQPPALAYDEPEEEDVPPPPPKRVSIPPPRAIPPPPPVASYADDTNEHDELSEHVASPPTSPRVHPTHRAGPPPPPPPPEPSRDDDSEAQLQDQPPAEPEQTPTEEDEETARRARIADRLRQQGGFNPFGAPRPPPVRKSTRPTETDAEVAVSPPSTGRRESAELPRSPPPPVRRENVELPRSPPPPVRRSTRPPSTSEAPERRASEDVVRAPLSPPMQPVAADEAVDDEGSQYSEEAAPQDDEEEVPPPPPPRRESLRPPHAEHIASPPSLKLPKRDDREVLDEEDGDPIDPSFYKLQRSPSSATIPAQPKAEEPEQLEEQEQQESSVEPAHQETVEDEEAARKRTLAERMAKLGGIRFGAPPPIARPPPPPPAPARSAEPEPEAPEHVDDKEEQQAAPAEDEEEDEFARKQRIAARLASMGGMRFGMFPTPAAPPAAPTPKSPPVQDGRQIEEEEENAPPPLPPSRPPPPRAAPPPPPPPVPESDAESEGYHQVEAEESEMEEVYRPEEEEEEAPPPVPARPAHRAPAIPDASPTPLSPSFRPPVPAGRPPPPPSARPAMSPSATHSDFVMVEAPDDSEEIPPPPPPRTASLRKGPPARNAPLPPPPPPPPADTPSQWESTLDFGGETDLSLSGQWSEDSTQYPAQQSHPSGSSNAGPPPVPSKLSADDLVAHWGRVGVQIHEVAMTLFDRSKRALIGDGTFVGFVTAVLDEVPTAAKPAPPYASFGYLIYRQVGAAVQVRASDILPGDVITLHDAKLKGHKGLQIYHQNVGMGEPVCAIIGDFETKKSKVKVFQANQHVGQQSVESVSYRLEDLKSGTVEIFRVLEG